MLIVEKVCMLIDEIHWTSFATAKLHDGFKNAVPSGNDSCGGYQLPQVTNITWNCIFKIN